MANVWRFLSLLLLTIFELFVFGIKGQSNCTPTQRCNDTVPNCFAQEKIVNDLIPEAPTEQLQVKYGDIVVMMGDELKPSAVISAPNVSFSSDSVADQNALYTLIMADPDAPSRANPTERSWKHWVVINSRFNNLQGGNVTSIYTGSQPPPNSCLHRYVFLVYQQDSTVPITMPVVNGTDGEGKWNVSAWVDQYNLQKPIAGNYFMAQNSVGYISPFLFLALITIAFTTLPM